MGEAEARGEAGLPFEGGIGLGGREAGTNKIQSQNSEINLHLYDIS